MGILSKILERKYCQSCYFKHSYYEHKRQYKNIKNIEAHNEKIQNFIAELVNHNQKLIYLDSSPQNKSICIVTVIQEFNYNGKLSCLTFLGYTFDNILFSHKHSQRLFVNVVHHEDKNSQYLKGFYIEDFLCEPNKGYGSIMMKVFLNYIKEFNAEYVSGFLSPFDTKDKEHSDRLHHFYKKFGFQIDKYDNIRLSLK
ncbi:MAG: hypothetical protein ACI4I4_07395 [Acutalibacteraceae bacterium]